MKNPTSENTFWKFVFIMEYVSLRITRQKRFDVRQYVCVYVWFHWLRGVIVDAEFWMGFPALNNVHCSVVRGLVKKLL
jgi:hypothetical protein